MKKFFKRCALLACMLVLIGTASIVTIGYERYQKVREELPLSEVVSQVQTEAGYTKLEHIDSKFIEAIIAVEDPSFYSHQGLHLAKIVEAMITDIIHLDYVMGGSTITQQLAKNLFLDQDKNLARKVAEAFLARDLEATLTKDEILELYLNVIYFGDGYYGIQEAAQGYFGKDASSLTLNEATLLAGLPQAPAVYQLSNGMELAKKRQAIVLQAMINQNLITTEQARLSVQK